MSTQRRPSVRKSEITRGVEALRAGGVPVTGMEIAPDGTVRLLTAVAPKVQNDDAFARWERQHGKEA